MTHMRALLGWSLALLVSTAATALAAPIDVNLRIVEKTGQPIAGMDVRVVVGSEKASRGPDAGKRLRTDGGGRVVYRVDAPIVTRKVKLDNVFARHSSQLIEVGVEMDLLGRRALYWIELDLVSAGVLGGMGVFLQRRGGKFDLPPKYDRTGHSWSFPDQPNGMMMSGIGAKLRSHDMKQAASGAWTVDLVLEKESFKMMR
ncbi:MAG: hypothetical protein Q8S27_01465 [Hoeflea sp.]|nr:hypothetical protein [Hoeflea sp.]